MSDSSTGNTLRIHHLDFGTSGGDATILALWSPGGELLQLVLIDGGTTGRGLMTLRQAFVNHGIAGNTPNACTIICSHYEDAYMGGLLDVLCETGMTGSMVTVYDRGQQGLVSKDATAANALFTQYFGESGVMSDYKTTLNAILPAKTGENVWPKWPSGTMAASVPQVTPPHGWTSPVDFLSSDLQNYCLLNSAGGENGFSIAALVVNGILQGGQNATQTIVGASVAELNMGYGLLISFAGFTYYHGGALLTSQEGGTPYDNSGVTAAAGASVMSILGDNKVQAIKLSRQGACTGSAQDFLAKMAPLVAVTTCGTDGVPNEESEDQLTDPSLPSQAVLQAMPTGTVTYLTGESLYGASGALDQASPQVVVAGCWEPGHQAPTSLGDVTIEVVAPSPGATATSFTVLYTAPLDAWTVFGNAKSYGQPVAYRDTYAFCA